MANGMGSLYIGHSGLRSSKDAINTVANNLANVNTAGYVRQRVVFRDTEYLNQSYSINGYKKLTGLGTSIGSLVHARDVFLDKAYRQDNGRQAYYETSYEAVDEVQNFFQELEGTAFQEILTGETSLWQSFEELSKDPSDTVNQNLVVQKASLFATRAQAIINGLANFQQSVNLQISEDIGKINDLAEQIYELNMSIQKIETSGRETAMNERDARDYAIDQLSQYGNISCTEAADGTVSLKFEGELMVDDMFCYQIGEMRDRFTGFVTPYWPHLSNEDGGKYVEVLDFKTDICTEYNTDIGELKALVQTRGTKISNYNDILNADPDLYDATTGLSVMQNTQAEFDQLVHDIVTKINDVLSPTIKMDELYVQTGDDEYVVYKNVWVLDEENCCVGADGKKPPQELFTRTGCERFQKVKGADGKDYYLYNIEDKNDSVPVYTNSKTFYVFNEKEGTMVADCQKDSNGEFHITSSFRPYQPWNKEGNIKYHTQLAGGVQRYVLNEDYQYDTSKQYTSLEIGVNYNLKRQITNLPHINNKDEIAYDIGHKLASLWQEDSLSISPRYTTTKYNFGLYYTEMIGEIGIIGSMYETTAGDLEAATAAVDHQRQGVIGVSSDEELTSMIKYQNAYNASSRYIQTVSDMIETLVTGL